jgi:Inhibitor of vertebrate lysozyme (Ivy)
MKHQCLKLQNFKLRVVFGLFLISLSSIALAQDTMWELPKRFPALLSTWRTVVPAKLRETKWIGSLDGTGGSTFISMIKGRPFFIGTVCMPHRCGDNQVTYLISVNSPEAYGMIVSEYLNLGQFWGSPDTEAKGLLRYAMEVVIPTANDPFMKKIDAVLSKSSPSEPRRETTAPSQGTTQKACERFPNLC